TPISELKSGDLVSISGKMPDYGTSFKINFIQKQSGKNAPRIIKTPIKSDEKLTWLLGFYLGDGYTEKTRVHFAVPESDKSYAKVMHLLREIFDIKIIPYKNTLRINSTNLVRFIKELGLNGNARTKRVPDWIYTLPIEQKRAFIAGYIAADGHIRKGHKNISITSCSKELLEQIKTLAISCGMNPLKISKWTRVEKKPLGKEMKEYTHYFLYFGEKDMHKPIQFIPITSITHNNVVDTYDLEIEGTHNFVADGFIVHNSKLTMKYPAVFLLGKGAKANILSLSFANENQRQDTGGKAIHLAPFTSSRIVSKSISKNNGHTSYRGLIHIAKGDTHAISNVKCDALLLDAKSTSSTFPSMKIEEENSATSHEAYTGKINEEQLFYLRSRGFNEEEATALIVLGFISDVTRQLPPEYALELTNLITMEITDENKQKVIK
ncbi:MAG: SufD family Fe-S cluster assembly protein, partial [Candidatus Micrarchaeota archaeon]